MIPDTAILCGNIRFFSNEIGDLASKRIKQLAQSIAEMNGCTAEVIVDEFYPPVLNHAEQVATVERIVKNAFGA